MKLYIIRHGQTDWNVQGRIQGRQDIPLNAAGRSQAGMLALGMKERPVSAVYSSPQLRAMETARALAEDQGVEVISVPELVEIGYGNWEGRTAQDILTRERKLYEEWWQRIKREMRGDTAVVAHGGTLAHFIVHLLEGRQDAEEIVVGNASITTMEYDPAAGQCSLLELNDCSHLMQK